MIGKGIIRFHAVYWPAILLSAGEPLPTAIVVHDYLTLEGGKLSKSSGNAAQPTELVDRYGPDALRWWFLRDVPRVGDADFREELLADRADELADDLGNLINRVLTLLARCRPGGVARVHGAPRAALPLHAAVESLPERIDRALEDFDFRAAAAAIVEVVAEGNRFISNARPWELAQTRARWQRIRHLGARRGPRRPSGVVPHARPRAVSVPSSRRAQNHRRGGSTRHDDRPATVPEASA
ncbi:MAG: class I tRNA ligase family protein [Solirubrobacterales bacterium]|nr:class I tRNA ligase family protein [Solirubrobacterales bacterium]